MMCLPNIVQRKGSWEARGKPNPCKRSSKGVLSLTRTQACIQTPAVHQNNLVCNLVCYILLFIAKVHPYTQPNEDNLLLSRVRLTFTLGFSPFVSATPCIEKEPNNQLHAALQEKQQGHQLIYTPAAHLLTCNKIKMLASPP